MTTRILPWVGGLLLGLTGALFWAGCSADIVPSGAVVGDAGAFDADPDGAERPGAPPTELSACKAFVSRYCQLSESCGFEERAACERDLGNCPHLFFAPGSTRTPSEVMECVARVAEQPCAELRFGIPAACAKPGTLETGEACTFTSQCKSLRCPLDEVFRCGTCTDRIADEGACTRHDDCGVSSYCKNGKCVPRDLPRIGLGGECTSNDCTHGNVCMSDTQGGRGTCREHPRLGDACGFRVGGGPNPCWPNSCREGVCVETLDPGDTCGSEDRCPPKLACIADRPGNETRCLVALSEGIKLGERCGPTYGECAAPHTCVDTVCVATVGAGEACDDIHVCSYQLACFRDVCSLPMCLEKP